MRSTLLSALALTFALHGLSACSCGSDSEQAPPEGQAESETSGGSGPTQVAPANPFKTGQVAAPIRETVLPDTAFWKEYRYPGSVVVDVKEVFGSTSAWLTSQDEFDTIDAFYKEKFTNAEGEVEGRSGRYHRLTDQNTRERVSIEKRVGGGCEIKISN